MLKYGNRDFRNLQEQVYANMKNIEDIIKGQDIIADYTLQIVGQVDSAEDLPDAETYDGKLGDIYVVGEASPFHGYAFVKVYENENIPNWVDLGAILVQGPQGEQGPQGIQGVQGPQGDQGVPAGFGVPTASIQGTTGTPNVSITASGPNTARVFDFTFYNLKGEKGDTGLPGAGVPEIQTTDAGKALIVDQQGEVAEWTELPSGLPDIESGDAGKLLAVNSAETGAEWVNDVLKLPASAPASQQLVGINTSGEQNALGIGDGLVISNNKVSQEWLSDPTKFSTNNQLYFDSLWYNIADGAAPVATTFTTNFKKTLGQNGTATIALSAKPKALNTNTSNLSTTSTTIPAGGIGGILIAQQSASIPGFLGWNIAISASNLAAGSGYFFTDLNTILTAGLEIIGFINGPAYSGSTLKSLGLIVIVKNPTAADITITLDSNRLVHSESFTFSE